LVTIERGAFDPSTGGGNDISTAWVVNGIVKEISLKELQRPGGILDFGDLMILVDINQEYAPQNLGTDSFVLLKNYGDDIKSGNPTVSISNSIATFSESQANAEAGAKIEYGAAGICYIKTMNSAIEAVVMTDSGSAVSEGVTNENVTSIKNDEKYKIKNISTIGLGPTNLVWEILCRRE